MGGAATDTPGKVAILVLGMHRSGTSALARVLGHLGCALPADGIGAHADNPGGYWEPEGLVRESDRVFRTARTSWFDPRRLDLATVPEAAALDHRQSFARAIAASFGDAPWIVVKDPRLSRLVPFAHDAAASLGYAAKAVVMTRSRTEIARSVAARDRSTPAYAQALWLRHMIDAERDSRDLPRAFVDYAELLADWRKALAPVIALGLAEPGEAAATEIDRHLDPALHRNRGGGEPLEPALEALMTRADAALAALRRHDGEAERAEMDAVAAAFDEDPRRIDDIVHDELRHRRVRDIAARSPEPEAEAEAAEPAAEAVTEPTPEPASPPQPAPPPAPPAAPGLRDIAAEIALVRDSGLLDEQWYRARYPDVAADADPVQHYLTVGAAEGRDPHPLFQTAYYARQMARRALLRDGQG